MAKKAKILMLVEGAKLIDRWYMTKILLNRLQLQAVFTSLPVEIRFKDQKRLSSHG